MNAVDNYNKAHEGENKLDLYEVYDSLNALTNEEVEKAVKELELAEK